MTDAGSDSCNGKISRAESREFTRTRDALLADARRTGHKPTADQVSDTLYNVLEYCQVDGVLPMQELTKKQFDYAKIHAPFAASERPALAVIDKHFNALSHVGISAQDTNMFRTGYVNHNTAVRANIEQKRMEERTVSEYSGKYGQFGAMGGAVLGLAWEAFNWINYPRQRAGWAGSWLLTGGFLGLLSGENFPKTFAVLNAPGLAAEPLLGAGIGYGVGKLFGLGLAQLTVKPALHSFEKDIAAFKE